MIFENCLKLYNNFEISCSLVVFMSNITTNHAIIYINRSLFLEWQGFYTLKSVSLFRFTMFLQGQIGLPFSIYNVITGSNQSPFFDLQCYYRVKSVCLSRFTRILQGEISLPFSIFSLFTVWNDSFPFQFTEGANGVNS